MNIVGLYFILLIGCSLSVSGLSQHPRLRLRKNVNSDKNGLVNSVRTIEIGNERHKNVKTCQNSTLKLLHVMFRHGDRTPDITELYPTDPFKDEEYYPVGYGQLTNRGKLRLYNVGKGLRDAYDCYLPQIYSPGIMDAKSTNYTRTKASLELVLAALFPPVGIQQWGPLQWQPLPYDVRSKYDDPLLYPYDYPLFDEAYRANEATVKSANRYDKNTKAMFEYIEKNSGMKMKTYEDLWTIYFGLQTEEEWGFTLPAWTKKIWPTFTTEKSTEQYNTFLDTPLLKKLWMGPFIQTLVNNCKAKIADSNSKMKLYLYSAHEVNLGVFLVFFDMFLYKHIPQYASYVAIELHEVKGIYYLKFIYLDNYQMAPTPKAMKLPNCPELCPLDTFISLYSEYM